MKHGTQLTCDRRHDCHSTEGKGEEQLTFGGDRGRETRWDYEINVMDATNGMGPGKKLGFGGFWMRK